MFFEDPRNADKIENFGHFGIQIPSCTQKGHHFDGLFCIYLVMEYYVYILRSDKSGIYYKGQTNSVFNRLSKHNSGYVKSTKAYRPWKLVFYTNVETRSEAVKLESKLKNLKSKERLEEWMQKNKGINNCQLSDGVVGPEKQ
jgi:putative endonuclease